VTTTEIERVYELLQTLDKKLDSFQQTQADTQSRLTGVEVELRSQADANNRFWTLTWPTEQKAGILLEERIRLLEREKAHSERVDRMEARINDVERNAAEAASLTKLDERLSGLEKVAVTTSTKFNLTNNILALIGSGVVSILVTGLMRYLMK
jgi:hypothetical protein